MGLFTSSVAHPVPTSNKHTFASRGKRVDIIGHMFLHKNTCHAIPPNPLLVNPTIEDIVRAGPLEGQETKVVPVPVKLFSIRGKHGPSTPPPVGEGQILAFRMALLYVPKA